jgi:hypothetical protein
MRADVCLHRNAAALAAAEDDGLSEQTQQGSAGGIIPTPLVALFSAPAVTHTELTYERIRFDPVPVYIGPSRGWKGPAMGAHPTTETAAAVAKTAPADDATTATRTAEGDASPATEDTPRSKHKPARHAGKSTATRKLTKPAKSAAEKVEKKDVSTN